MLGHDTAAALVGFGDGAGQELALDGGQDWPLSGERDGALAGTEAGHMQSVALWGL